MPKFLRVIAIVAVAFLGMFFLAKVTGVFRIYNTFSTANEPALKLNTPINVSNIPSYKPGDFIVYGKDTITRVHRLVAIENDILQIKNGVVYVNNNNFDRNLKLMHTYRLDDNQYNGVKNKLVLTPGYNEYGMPGQHILMLEDEVAKNNSLTALRFIAKKNEPDNIVSGIFGSNGNKDNLGPLVIPKNKVFVLGDNRDNSEDSRYLGFIDKSTIKAVVLR